ncbi:MAG: trans-aconitate 2-methyltransferase [Kordiimonas sp.]
MTFYHNTDNAVAYAKMCEGYDAADQLGLLHKHLPTGAKLLEIGSGPGNDIALLNEKYDVTASDYSPAFLKMVKERFPDVMTKLLDAVALDIEGPFNAIYSNKVLQHLTDDELSKSFSRQASLLSDQGLIYHLIWTELDYPDAPHGLQYIARSEQEIATAMAPNFEVVATQSFGEFSDNDSLVILARKLKQ